MAAAALIVPFQPGWPTSEYAGERFNTLVTPLNNMQGNGTPTDGTFAALTSTSVKVDTGTKTAAATGTTTATATLNKNSGVVTSASLTTAAGATWVLTLTNSAVAATSIVLATVGTAGTGQPTIANVVPGAGSVAITVQNIHASAAFNNTISVSFVVFQA